MQGSGAPEARMHPPSIYRTGWVNLASKVSLALLILLLVAFDNPVGRALAWTFQNPNPLQPTLLVWGAAVVG